MAGKSKASGSVEEFLATAKPEDDTVRELRLRLARQERTISKLRTHEQLILDAVDSVLRDAPPRITVPVAPKHPKRKSDEIAILHYSDIQLGKVTKTYNTQVAEERVMRIAEKTIRISNVRRASANINELHVYLGGDMIEGEDIFPHQAHEIDSPLYEQAVLNCPRIFTRALLRLLQAFPLVKVYTVAGNHGRNGPKSTRSSPRTNWDDVFYHVLGTILMGHRDHPRHELEGRLEYHQSDDFWIVDRVFDWGNLLVHGHQITGGFAGFPWYGTAKKAWGWIDAIEEPWDNLWFGHFHTPAMATLGHRRFYANGTTESDNNFAKEQLAACGVPAQRLAFMTQRHGIISDDMLELVDRQPSSRRFFVVAKPSE